MMNKVSTLLCFIVLTVVTSCQFSENIYIKEDGSGKMEFSFDGSQIMKMAGEEMNKSQEKAVDSTFSFKEILEEKHDSISKLSKEDQLKLKQLEPFSMHMLMNPETSEMKFDMFTNFESVSELQDMFKAMQSFSELKKGKGETENKANAIPSLGTDGSTALDYSYDGKIFRRTARIIDQEAYKKVIDSLGQMEMMLGASKYTLNYHFPKRIKSVSNEAVMFSEDRKSFKIEFGFMDYVKNPEALNLEVVLED